MPEALGRIETLRTLCAGHVVVQVDGGVSAENTRRDGARAADLLVAGSAIFWHGRPGSRVPRLADDGPGCGRMNSDAARGPKTT